MSDTQTPETQVVTQTEAVPEIYNVPPVKFERDENGLLKHIQHKFTPEGYVDWRGMVPIKYLYVNPDKKRRTKIEKKYGKPLDEIDVVADKVEDADLVIKLGGIKYLLALRGYSDVYYAIKEASADYAGVYCSIIFTRNFETENESKSFGDNACAFPGNTRDFGQKYLLELATNRAFCRTVRNFLKIDIVSAEELGAVDEEVENNSTIGPLTVLMDLMKDKKLDFSDLKRKKLKEGYHEAQNWETLEDIPGDIVEELIKRLKKMKGQTDA